MLESILCQPESGTSQKDCAYIFQTVQVLVALAANLAFIRLLLFHAESAGIRS